jgi:hypothetical protein
MGRTRRARSKARWNATHRKLNAVTIPNAYPLLRMDDLLQSMGRTGCIRTIDLQAGYGRSQPGSRTRTRQLSFAGSGYSNLPFDLRDAPVTFQRLMDRFRAGLPDLTLLAYLDELVLFSATKQEHLVQLECIFHHIRHFKLRMKTEKCFFGCPEVRYLGHRISAAGIVPSRKITRLRNGRPSPSCGPLTSSAGTSKKTPRWSSPIINLSYG